MYDKYQDILTGQSEKDKEEFLRSDATLDQFRVSPSCIKVYGSGRVIDGSNLESFDLNKAIDSLERDKNS